MRRKLFFWTVVVPLLVLTLLLWGACRDINEKDTAIANARQHRDRLVLAELARIDRALKERPPKTLGEAVDVLGHEGWCGYFKGSRTPSATWTFRAAIPEGDTRVWPIGNEDVWGQAVRASVESCDRGAKVKWIEVGKPEHVRLPGR